jgi:hypothetical protein
MRNILSLTTHLKSRNLLIWDWLIEEKYSVEILKFSSCLVVALFHFAFKTRLSRASAKSLNTDLILRV